jgi:hypothetical protein
VHFTVTKLGGYSSGSSTAVRYEVTPAVDKYMTIFCITYY